VVGVVTSSGVEQVIAFVDGSWTNVEQVITFVVGSVGSTTFNSGNKILQFLDPWISQVLKLLRYQARRLTVSHWPYLGGCFLGHLLLW